VDASSLHRADAHHDPASRPLGLFVRGERVDVVVQPTATVGELAELLGFDPQRPLVVDACRVDPPTLVVDAGLSHGSDIGEHDVAQRCEYDVAERSEPGARPAVRVTVVAGVQAGRSWDLPPGDVVVGSARSSDVRLAVPGVGRHHALGEIGSAGDVRWTDLTDTAPVPTSDARISRIGPVLLRSGPVPGTKERSLVPPPAFPGWTVPWLRPVSPPARPPIAPVRPPAPSEPPTPPGPLGLAALITPLVVGVVAMVLLRQPLLLLLGGAAAFASLVPRLVQITRAGRGTRRARRDADAELQRFARDLDHHRRAATDRAWDEVFDVAAALETCEAPDNRLWARRPHAPDAFTVTLGVGSGSYRPVLDAKVAAPTDDPAVWALVEAASELNDVPVSVALADRAVIGIVGDVDAARAIARAIVVQLAALHGPADLVLAAISDPPSVAWEWMTWLPHAHDSGTAFVSSESDADAFASAVSTAAGGRHAVLVVDGASMLGARSSAVRQLLDGGLQSVAAVVIGPEVAALPSRCTTVVEARTDGSATRRSLASTGVPERLVAAGLAAEDALHAARGLARFEDPEAVDGGANLPETVGLLDVLPPATLDPPSLVSSWCSNGPDPRPATVLGLGAEGPVEIDLVRDGPHVLVAGTTGAGKSELLRSLVVGLAAGQAPEGLTFVLVDYKGGSAFDACDELPHVVGVVTDLDPGSAERVLRSLGAELARREQLLRDAGANDLAAYRRLPDRDAIPRLVVVVDEFATLSAEHPAFLGSLVGVAQRGRSLGVHLVLATQRPAGVVSDDIRANTNLRISLRVQDPADSVEVLGDSAAAALPRRHPGRALARFGLGELVALQVACAGLPVPDADPPPVVTVDRGSRPVDPLTTSLAATVDAIRRAAETAGSRRPSRPWTDPLPPILPAAQLPPGVIGLVDDPGQQRQHHLGWDRSAGHLVVIGAVGSGTTTTLVTAALGAAVACPPDCLHLYVVDHGAGGLVALAALPHAGAVIGATERERQLRLLHLLAAELDLRRGAEVAHRPELLVVVDDLVGWRRSFDASGEHDAVETLDRILSAGPDVGIVVAASVTSDAGLPRALDGTVSSCLTLRGAEPGAADGSTLRRDVVPGRGVEVGTGLEVQVAYHGPPEPAAASIAHRWRDVAPDPAPTAIGTLPERIALSEIPPAVPSAPPWLLPLGIDDSTLGPAVLRLHPGDHLLVSGPSRSGRTSTLRAIVQQVVHARPDADIVCLGFRGRAPDGATAGTALDELNARDPRRLVVVVDDAELLDDPHGVLASFVARRDAIVVAAARADALRTAYGHWTADLRRQRRGIVLCPTADVDGDVLGVVIPRRRTMARHPGRGYLVVDGEARLIQVAVADPVDALRGAA
jgi:DNA segregation ATPase FtsK/SpoIIIE, S-DNA-T family